MNTASAQDQLRSQGKAILALASGLTLDQARWKPGPESWSVLEVLNHLVDEELLDFRCHLEHILYSPKDPWPEIDPQGWISEKKYNEQDLVATLTTFQKEREKSITWLGELDEPNLKAKSSFPWGEISAGDMLASWLAHDLLHLRQLVELRYALTMEDSQPYGVRYAGEW
ncbi:MAG: DinB family protein [Chloroflexota bacterium]|jgi:uncharacterized damage-inducible protein DinB|nr:DinB family protein [Chloroflexota bacterium]